MKYPVILCIMLILALTVPGQTPKTTPKKAPKSSKIVVPAVGGETEELEKARTVADPALRAAALQTFLKNFPASAEAPKVQGLIVTARAESGLVKMQAGDLSSGIELFKQAVADAPVPVPDETFSKVLVGLPVSLFALNQRGAAFDVAKLIEEKVGTNAGQVLDLAKFYLNVEYGTEAIRLAQKAAEIAPSAAAFQTLGAANRLNFRLEDAANSYAKAIELDGESVASRLSLAEMKRALGKTDEAAAVYREILTKDAENTAARTGLALTLFDADKRAEAEAEMKRALEAEPNNSKLLAGAAYWYAARGMNEQAIEHAQKAIALEPRNVWSYIAQARALLAQNKPLEAEKILLTARAYSDFPTLDYEIASVRLAAGLYREAAETLKRSFTVNGDGLVETYLGNRILADAGSFTELLSLERRTAIFELKPADSPENTEQLKALLAFNQKLESEKTSDEEIAAAAEEFARGADNMRLHRQLFAANILLQKKKALPKVLELTQAAIGGVDAGLNVAAPSAAVLADEIYETRQYAISQNLVIVVPDIPRQTLSAIVRGRIEDLAGRAFFQQNNLTQSIVRLKRALSVLPEKSAFSRASYWHLGEVLQADGREKEALEAYIKAYNKEIPDAGKRAFIENLYVKVNGNVDGLEERVGVKNETTVAATETKNTPNNTDNVKTAEPSPEVKAEPSPAPKTEEKSLPAAEIKPLSTPTPQVEPATETTPAPAIEPAKTPEPTPSPTTQEAEITPTTLNTAPTPEITEVKETPTKPEPAPSETPKTEDVKTEDIKTEEAKPEPSPAPTPIAQTEETPPSETKTSPSPTPALAVVISDNLKQIPPSPKSSEQKKENQSNERAKPNPSKPLFESVIISVGKTETTEPQPAKEKPVEELQKTESALTETPPPEQTKAETPGSETKSPDDKIATGENRPRIIITENTGSRVVTEEIATCKININQENLSLLNGGGSLGVMVGFEGEGDFRLISAVSSSPRDVDVRLDPEIGASQRRAFFVIKSVSTQTGIFTVTFEAPCGKKEVLVKVR